MRIYAFTYIVHTVSIILLYTYSYIYIQLHYVRILSVPYSGTTNYPTADLHHNMCEYARCIHYEFMIMNMMYVHCTYDVCTYSISFVIVSLRDTGIRIAETRVWFRLISSFRKYVGKLRVWFELFRSRWSIITYSYLPIGFQSFYLKYTYSIIRVLSIYRIYTLLVGILTTYIYLIYSPTKRVRLRVPTT